MNLLQQRTAHFVFWTALLSSAAVAQQAPLPPGTHAPDSAPVTESSDPLAPAEAKLAAKDYEGARALLTPYLSAHPKDARALFDLGFVEDSEDHVDAALAAYRQSVAADATQFEPQLALGLLLARQGQRDEARQHLDAAVALDPAAATPAGRAEAYRALARLNLTSDPSAAKDALLKALALSPEAPGDALLTAEIAEANGDDETADSAYRQVLAKHPDSSEATAGLVHLLLKQKKYADAEPLLRAALGRDPDDPALNSQLASTLAAQGKEDEALTVLEKLHTLAPGDENVSAMLADAYTRSGAPEKADPIFTGLLRNSPQNADLLIARGENLISLKRYPEALAVLKQAVTLKPDDPDAWGGLAFASSEAKDYSTTLEALSMRAKYIADTPLTYFLRATAYDHLHQTKQAAEFYHRFLDAAAGKFPDQEWEAQHRLLALAKMHP